MPQFFSLSLFRVQVTTRYISRIFAIRGTHRSLAVYFFTTKQQYGKVILITTAYIPNFFFKLNKKRAHQNILLIGQHVHKTYWKHSNTIWLIFHHTLHPIIIISMLVRNYDDFTLLKR